MVSRREMAKGLLTTRLAGLLLEAAVDAFSHKHLAVLKANHIDFFLVFDVSGDEISELTEQYATQNRMVALAGPDEGLRLRVAAVRGVQPAAGGSATFRCEVDIQRRCQFTVPDIHIITARGDAAESAAFWFGDDCIRQRIDRRR